MDSINNKFYSLLGLCKRAGKLVSGGMLCENAVRSGKSRLIFLSCEASQGTLDKFTNLCRHYNAELITVGEKEVLGRSIGKESRTVVAVIDKVFQQMLMDLIEESKTSTGVVSEWQK